MKLQNDPLQVPDLSRTPFDLSGCPNLRSVTLNFYEPKHYIDALNDLHDFQVKELDLSNLKLFPSKDDTVLDLKIPISVRLLWLRPLYSQNGKAFESRPYSITLPHAMEKLEVRDVPIFISNIHDVEWLENVKFTFSDYEILAPTIYQLSSHSKEMGKIEFSVTELRVSNGQGHDMNFQHLPKLKNRVLHCYEFLQCLDDLPRAAKFLSFTLVIGHFTLHLHSSFGFWRNDSERKGSLTRYL
ncbi:unnamed protein product [Ambrosiozyma monospora]|uniref:Unnamed protein product n=1 Tax=Ambrosiozyma monospora TaxID=43982 RepID=A0ACB5STS6_AMBMO|nr:unnamed protein product [Ambrosiozyma monospora]